MKNILQMLELDAQCCPDSPAYCDEKTSLTWLQTLQAAQAVGSALATREIRGRPVAIYLAAGTACIKAMLGVLAAGGYYTVLDVKQPPERICAILKQLEPKLILCEKTALDVVERFAGDVEVLPVEEAEQAEKNTFLLSYIRHHAIDTDLAYVLFTSGSSGTPKGVAVSHRSVLVYSEWVSRIFDFGAESVLGNQTPFYFSMSVTDIYGAMCAGSCVEILPRRLFSFPLEMVAYLRERAVNTLYWVPSALGILASWKALDCGELPPLHTVLFAGEVMPTPKLNYWRKHYPDALFANLYGPTETTDICAYYILNREFEDHETLPIGWPCDNCDLFILKDGRRAQGAEAGELCVRGSFLAAGYYGSNQMRGGFCQNPLQNHYPEQIYKTGDLVRYGDNGELLYCGRIDQQIKHNGYRIEPGEIEAAAYGVAGVDECACVFDAEQDSLALFYYAPEPLNIALNRHLRSALPRYMLPKLFYLQEQLPHNASGKIDRKKLCALLPTLALEMQ